MDKISSLKIGVYFFRLQVVKRSFSGLKRGFSRKLSGQKMPNLILIPFVYLLTVLKCAVLKKRS
jgi:hypothetical protein